MVAWAGCTAYVTHAGAPATSPRTGSVPVAMAQFSTSSRLIGLYVAPVLRRVSRSTVETWTEPPVGSMGRAVPAALVKTNRSPVTCPGDTPAGRDRPGPVCGAEAAKSLSAQTESGRVQASTVTRSAPRGKLTGPMPVTSKRSNTCGLDSSRVNELTRAVDDEALRTPRTMVLASSLPATALPSGQDLVATGVTTLGTSTMTSARSLAVGALSAVTLVVLATTIRRPAACRRVGARRSRRCWRIPPADRATLADSVVAAGCGKRS